LIYKKKNRIFADAKLLNALLQSSSYPTNAMHKRWILPNTDDAAVQHLTDALGISPVLCRLLVQRNIRTFDDAKQFFRPSLDQLHDPFLMQDMEKAVDRLERAIQNQEKVLLYGDYDVDGTTSVALMFDFLEKKIKHLDYYIPDRYKEGYGISLVSIEYAKVKEITLIIAMDCGIKAVEQVALANTYGIDCIICDHHVPDEILPNAIAILDPKRPDCAYPFKELSGCGIAFKLAQALLQRKGESVQGLEKLLDLLVLSIACDLVSMRGENRILAHFGLKRLNEDPRLGIRSLISVRGKEFPLSISDLVFGIGPLINAPGRLSDAKLAVRLLLASERNVASDYAQLLVSQNTLRREVELEIMREAELMIAADKESYDKTIVIFSPKWHKGVLGIIAARISENFHRPTVVLAESDGKIVGSARTVGGFDVYKALQRCEPLMESFGGHAFAAGLVMPTANLAAFKAQFTALGEQTMVSDQLIPEINISSILPLKEVSATFYKILRQFAPFGPDNMRPVFIATDIAEQGLTRLSRNEQHLLFSIKVNDGQFVQGVGFSMGSFYVDIRYKNFDMCYVLDENTWKNDNSIRFQVKDIRIKE
jgi:single-stranded-DNA-specific exonuclease